MARAAGPDPIDAAVGDRLRQVRRARNVSQAAVAEALGITFQQVQKYERGTNRISASMLVKAARFLNVPTADLLGEFGSEGDDKVLTDALRAGSDAMTPHGRAAALAMNAIRSPRKRRRLLDVMRSMADDSADTPPSDALDAE